MRTTLISALALAGLVLSACTPGAEPESEAPLSKVTSRPSDGPAPLDPSASLTAAGLAMREQSGFPADAPRIDVTASADPATGEVAGVVRARLPVGATADRIRLRYFAGLESLDAKPDYGPVLVDGTEVAARRDAAIITVALPAEHDPVVGIRVPFSYTLPKGRKPSALDGLGRQLEPADIGLLSRHEDSMALGHWFPIWVPEGRRDDPAPSGFGDISNYQAADMSLELTVPEGWTVVDGGVRDDESTADGKLTVRSSGAGMRDLSAVVLRGYQTKSREVAGGLTITATAPRDSVDQLESVLDETEDAISTLSDDLGAYPWREFDVVSTPLGASVGGMEWPGGTWIEANVLAGNLPGIGDLGGLLGDMDDLGGMLGQLSDEFGDVGVLVTTLRPWTIAHEVAHSWWTILVGNDSIASPVVDEPLAQYSACLVLRESTKDGDEACLAQIGSGYEQMRAGDVPDGVADRATDEFSSAAQYGGLVYSKAPWFYLELEKRYGRDKVRAALHDLVAAHAYDTVTADQVRAVLVDSLDEQAGALWDRWMEQVHGDGDMPTSAGAGTLRDLGDLEDLDLGQLEDLLKQLQDQ